MAYAIQIMPRAGSQMNRLPEAVKSRVHRAILDLAETPRPAGCLKLHGEEDAWRIRVGDYRIVYEIHDAVLVVLIIRVDHRSTVYR